jgi:DNA-binding NtrC family response regulator
VGNGQVVLVVEDQDSLRRFATKVLEKHGYTVLHAESGVLALALMENVDRIDVLFSDVVLPGGMLGPELAQHFVRRYPRGKVIFTSGYADVSAFSEIDISANPLLRKPYGMAELLDTVNNSLRNNGGVPDLRSPEPELDRLSEEH